MNQQRHQTLLETTTTLSPAEVLAAAKHFFSRRASIYAAFLEQESETHVSLRGQGFEEVVIGVRPAANGTAVTGSTYLYDQQVTRFFASLPPAPAVVPQPPGTTEGEGVDVAPATADSAAASGAGA